MEQGILDLVILSAAIERLVEYKSRIKQCCQLHTTSIQCCPKRFSIKTKKGCKSKVERTTLAKSNNSFTSYGKYNTFRTSNR